MKMYRGIVIDTLEILQTRETHWYATYEEAHKAAENLCKKTYKGRGAIDVITKEE